MVVYIQQYSEASLNIILNIVKESKKQAVAEIVKHSRGEIIILFAAQ